jgi:hypothetical protein
MNKIYLILVILLCVGMLAGCVKSQQPAFTVHVDSINSGTNYDKKTYALFPGNKDTSSEDLQFREYASYVHLALSSIGLTKKEGENPADIAIFLAYGIGDAQTQQYTYSVPTWGVTGYSSSTTFGSVATYGNYGTYSGTTYNRPQYGITGATTNMGTYTTFFRWMILDAYDVPSYLKEKKIIPVWKTTVTSNGSSGDLRRVFPALLAASVQHIGTNTGQKLEISIYEDDPVISIVKGIPLQKNEQEK